MILARDGHSADEIGAALGENPRRIIRVARQAKPPVKLAGRGGYRQVRCGIRRRHYETLNNLAEAMDVSKAAALERLLRVTLDKGMQVILKDLGKEARPKRKYGPRARKVTVQTEAA
jgi:hypothetical protein